MGGRILVIDDEQLLLKSIEKALEKVGYTVQTAGNREEFLSSIERNIYDLVILDIHMEDLKMEEIIRLAKEKMPDVKFLIISGDEETTVEHPFIQKPFRIEVLRSKVKELIDGKDSRT
jgi:DNA-binding response OmpR family regulator